MSDQEPKQVNFCAEKRFSLSYDALNTMRRNNQFCDVLFVVGGKKIAAHKLILASHSNYFNQMFTGNFKDTTVLEVKNVEITPNSLELLLDFLYTSQLTINDSNVQDLLMASIFLSINDVKKECLNYIEQTIDIENCMTIKSIADINKIGELHELFLSYVLKNYNNIVKSNTFLSFSFELMMELIQSDDLCAEEEEVYESTMMWLKYNLNERSKHLPELMKSIRLSLLSVDYLDSTVQEEELIQSDNTCMRFLCHAYKAHLQKKPMDNELVLAYNNTCRKFTKSFDNLKNEDLKDNFSSLEKFLKFKDSPKFMSLKFEQMMELIKSDDLCAEELQVFGATISWVKYDVKNRSELFPELFLEIRLSLMQVIDLAIIVEREELVSSNSICMDFLHKTYKLLLFDKMALINASHYSAWNIFNHRNHNLKQILVLYRKSFSSKIEWFDNINNTCYECSLTWPSDDTTSNLILTDGRIFSMSCSDGINSVKLFDGHLKIWKSIKTPVFVHRQSNIIQFYNQVYVISSSGVEYYDILKETWQEVKFKISGNYDFKLAVVSNLIYGVCKEKAFYYDPKTDLGQIICSLIPDILEVYSICSFNNQLCVIGGDKNNRRMKHYIVFEKYNRQTNEWTYVKNKETFAQKPGVNVLNGILYVMGGENSSEILFYDNKLKEFKPTNGHLKSTIQLNIQAFVIDTKSIKQKNILEYYSNNEI